MTTLVIGAGLIGSHVARHLVDRGQTPVLIDVAPQSEALGEIVDLGKVRLVRGDVMDMAALDAVVDEHRIRSIAHFAVNPMLTSGAQSDPYAAVSLNVIGTLNVLEIARKRRIGRVVVASSNTLGNFLTGGEGRGDTSKEEAFPRPLSFYAATKQAIESIGLNYARWCGVDFVALRYGAVMGPWGGRGGGGPSNMIRASIESCLRGEDVEIPPFQMEWVDVRDAAAATVSALAATGLCNRVFNITMGEVTAAEALVAVLARRFPGAKIRTKSASPGDGALLPPPMLRASDLGLARDQLGYAPAYRMDDCVSSLADWLARRLPGSA